MGRPRDPETPVKHERWLRLLAEGKSRQEVARLEGVHPQTIARVERQLGAEVRASNIKRGQRQPANQRPVIDDLHKHVGITIKTLRDNILPASKFANAVRISPIRLYEIEHGIYSPSLEELGRFAGMFGLTVIELLDARNPGDGSVRSHILKRGRDYLARTALPQSTSAVAVFGTVAGVKAVTTVAA